MKDLAELAQLDIDQVAADDRLRSIAMEVLVNHPQPTAIKAVVPRVLVQFWDTQEIPVDVRQCLESWDELESRGFTRTLFDKSSARAFIEENFDDAHVRAFDRCSHPAMQADYFRLCFIYCNGGVYVDADDEYVGGDLERRLSDGSLKLNPLCYQISADSMVDPFGGLLDASDLIYYVNNNPLVAPARHPLVAAALAQATRRLQAVELGQDIQTITGPGNLTEALVRHALTLVRDEQPFDFQVLRDWESVAISKWPLDYRADDRNWRRWARGRGQE